MEEDIELLERLIEEGFSAMCPLEAQALENLIKEYRVKELQLHLLKEETNTKIRELEEMLECEE